jgi:hypothetical protein
MLDALLPGVSAVVGGLFGWLNRREDRRTRKADQEFELRRIEAQSSVDIKKADADAFVESQKSLSRVGDAIKSAVRPLITGWLLYMTWRIWEALEAITGGIESFSAQEAADLYKSTAVSIISLTTMAVSWWFASRPSSINRS